MLGALVKSKANREAAEAQAAHDTAALMFSRALPSLNSHLHETSVESVQATTLLVCSALVPIYIHDFQGALTIQCLCYLQLGRYGQAWKLCGHSARALEALPITYTNGQNPATLNRLRAICFVLDTYVQPSLDRSKCCSKLICYAVSSLVCYAKNHILSINITTSCADRRVEH